MVPPEGPTLGTLWRVLSLLRAYRARSLATLALGVGMIAITTTLPLVTRTIIDQGLIQRRPGVLAREIAVLLTLGAVRWACAGSRRALGGRVGADVEYDLRTRIGRHLLALEPGWHDRAETGQLLSRASSDIRSIRYFLTFGQAFSVLNALTVLIAAVQLWRLSPRLSLIALAFAPPLVVGAIRYSRRLHRVFWRIQQTTAELTTVVAENAAGVRVVKSFGREAFELARLEGAAAAIRDENLRAARLRARYGPALANLPELALLVILAYGGRLAIDGDITLGTLVAFNSYLIVLAQPLRSFGMLFGIAQRAAASAGRVFEILDRSPAIVDRPGAEPLPDRPAGRSRGVRVDVEDVGVHYAEATRPALAGISLTIRSGERVALVGPTGAGKSTLAGLLPRLHEPTAGRVLLDGHDVNGLTLGSLRRAIGVVPQEPALFSATLRDNVAYGPVRADDDEIRAALHVAAALELEGSLPAGLDTLIGEQGHTLSGGQRQRVALARALLRRPRLLILDDALSQVDAATEARILTRLDDAVRGATVLLITSRPAVLGLADRIVLMEDGRVIADGDHHELTRREPRCRAVLADAGENIDGLVPEATR